MLSINRTGDVVRLKQVLILYAGLTVQRFTLLCAPGLVKFVLAVAYLLCLALLGSFLTMF